MFLNDFVDTAVGAGYEAHDTEADDKRALDDSPGLVLSGFGMICHQFDYRRHDEAKHRQTYGSDQRNERSQVGYRDRTSNIVGIKLDFEKGKIPVPSSVAVREISSAPTPC